jgi:hypothetical protein
MERAAAIGGTTATVGTFNVVRSVSAVIEIQIYSVIRQIDGELQVEKSFMQQYLQTCSPMHSCDL